MVSHRRPLSRRTVVRGTVAAVAVLVALWGGSGIFATGLDVTNETRPFLTQLQDQANTSTCVGSVKETVPRGPDDKITAVTVSFTSANTCRNASVAVTVTIKKKKADQGTAKLPLGEKSVSVPTQGKATTKDAPTYEVAVY
jgi:hypothetical protein